MSLHRDRLFDLTGQTALVTGASGFLGRTLCETLLTNGARVMAVGRSASLLEQCDEWALRFGDSMVVPCQIDLSDVDAFETFLGTLATMKVDVLVNNAFEMGSGCGFNVPEGDLDHISMGMLSRNMAGGVYWPVRLMQAVGGGMKERQTGVIINISSMYGLVAPSPLLYEGTSFMNPVGYSAAKAGMLALTRYAASFWGRDGIRVNAILPGPFSNVETVTENSVLPESPFLDRLRERTALGRTGAAFELAGALLFLSSDASSFVTGHALVVDGGWTIT